MPRPIGQWRMQSTTCIYHTRTWNFSTKAVSTIPSTLASRMLVPRSNAASWLNSDSRDLHCRHQWASICKTKKRLDCHRETSTKRYRTELGYGASHNLPAVHLARWTRPDLAPVVDRTQSVPHNRGVACGSVTHATTGSRTITGKSMPSSTKPEVHNVLQRR